MLKVFLGLTVGILLGIVGGIVFSECSECDKPEPTFVISADEPRPQLKGKSVVIEVDQYGRFEAGGKINGWKTHFVIDTGATSIVISELQAKALGIHLTPQDYKARAMTASGIVKFARTNVDSIEIGDIVVRNVPIAVMPGKLDFIALGMPFIARLSRFEYRGGRLLLEQ